MTDRIDQLSAHVGLVVEPYRNDLGQHVWVFRCWGTNDGCDGWLSLDHASQQSAERARDRHVTEEHASQADGIIDGRGHVRPEQPGRRT